MNIRQFVGMALVLLTVSAQAEVVVIAHPSVNVSSLPQSALSRLFFGQSEQLPGGIKAVPLDVSGPSKDQFAQAVLKKTAQQVDKYWARMIFTGKANPPREIRPADVKAVVASTPGAISYIDKSQLDGSVRVISVTN